ncbi:MAG: VOC family protein [Alphaproteobacteria bacterium]|nr:VOC family protein [Alphaproteobacteria bacterium]
MSTGYAPYIAHMGIACFDIERMIHFYGQVFGLKLTDRGVGISFPYKLAFMSAHPTQHHQLAFAQNRPEGAPSTIMQISFKVNDLAQLREARNRALTHGATKMRCISHGNAVSIYCMDPEDNIVEVYFDTPWYVAQPHGDPIDLDAPDEQIWADIEKVVRADPTFMPVEQWQKEVFAKI